MRATIVDLRYRTKEILQALDRCEQVTISCHGKVKGTIVPTGASNRPPIAKHQFFGLRARDRRSVDDVMDDLRGGRYR